MSKKNRMLVKFIPTQEVRLKPKNVISNIFHYGELPDVNMRVEKGIVIKNDFDRHVDEMSYLVRFESISSDNEQWFLESELY